MMLLGFLAIAMLPVFLVKDLRGRIYVVPDGYDRDLTGIIALTCFWGTIMAVLFAATTLSNHPIENLIVVAFVFCALGPIFSLTAIGNRFEGKIAFIVITIILWSLLLKYLIDEELLFKGVF